MDEKTILFPLFSRPCACLWYNVSDMTNDLLQSLNPEQRAAAEQADGPILVFAGAGSGKTRVLTMRIASLIRDHHVRPYNILAVTFTNKAANEMKHRLIELMGEQGGRLWAGTFHGICARILRENGSAMGIDPAFTILDDADQMDTTRSIMKALDIDPKRYQPRQILGLISRAKEKLIGPKDFRKHFNGQLENMAARVYPVYQEQLSQSRSLDFDDLIMQSVLLLQNCAEVREHYQDRFRYVHVDEFQDINLCQYMLITAMSGKHRNLFCVGDDDQSIYRWRGADVSIILRFKEDFPDAKIFKLEQNYRSTGKIIEAAHSVIKRNKGRADKKLWTDNEAGCDIEIIQSVNEHDEAGNIARGIQQKVGIDGHNYSDCVVLYRVNAMSRVFEEAMINRRIPYKLVGSVRFYERKEVKDILAYMRLAANPLDSSALHRIINVPTRGIGDTSITRLEAFAYTKGISFAEALYRCEEAENVPKRAVVQMNALKAMINHFHMYTEQANIRMLTEEIIQVTGYLNDTHEQRTAENQAKQENVNELLSVTQDFVASSENATLQAFLEQVALISDIDTYDESGQAVTLMTLHAAKGLEFPIVYMAGMEEGIFPHWRANDDKEEMEEERRLCYVGMTRAREQLVMSYALQRTTMGQTQRNSSSRFIEEIPESLVAAPVRPKDRSVLTEWRSDFKPKTTSTPVTFKPATKVVHAQFGKGVVINSSGSGDNEMVTVAFDSVGIKKLLVSFAALERV